jgi:hypothetical protein
MKKKSVTDANFIDAADFLNFLQIILFQNSFIHFIYYIVVFISCDAVEMSRRLLCLL